MVPTIFSPDHTWEAKPDIVPSELRASADLALVMYFLTPTIARAAKIPMIATTIINSTRVKPRELRFFNRVIGTTSFFYGFRGQRAAGQRTCARSIGGPLIPAEPSSALETASARFC